jgi:hypothetical protein
MTVAFAAGALKGAKLLSGVAKRLKQPSEKRAAKVAPQAVASANAGNLTAARMIADRTTFGIAKERAVWQAALAQVNPQILSAAKNARLPNIDESTPEAAVAFALANPVMIGGAAAGQPSLPFTPMSYPTAAPGPSKSAAERAAAAVGQVAQVVGSVSPVLYSGTVVQSEPVPYGSVGRGRNVRYDPATAQRWGIVNDGSDPRITQWPSRKPSLRAATSSGASSSRTHVRYNPSTGLKVRVPVGSYEDINWPTRKPTQSRLQRQAVSTVTKAAGTIASTIPATVAEVGITGAAGAAALGLLAYAVTSTVIDSLAQGETPENMLGLATALAHSKLTRQLGRQPTADEYRALQSAVRQEFAKAINLGTYGPIGGAVVNGLNYILSRF